MVDEQAELEMELGDLERMIASDPQVVAAEAELEQAHQAERGLQLQIREAEGMAADLRAQIRAEDGQLYGGTIHDPRQLRAISAELDHLRSRLAQFENRELDLMEQLELAQGRTTEAGSQLELLLGERQAEMESMLERRQRLQSRLETSRSRVLSLWQQLPEAWQLLYGRVRSQLRPPLAVVEVKSCSACRVAFTAAELQQLRRGDHPMTCQSCHRIVVAV